MSTTSTISPTLIGRRASASRFRINTRDPSPRHRNQLAHTSAEALSTFINIDPSRYCAEPHAVAVQIDG
jgi:CRISPR/Cas system-associated protein Csm6